MTALQFVPENPVTIIGATGFLIYAVGNLLFKIKDWQVKKERNGHGDAHLLSIDASLNEIRDHLSQFTADLAAERAYSQRDRADIEALQSWKDDLPGRLRDDVAHQLAEYGRTQIDIIKRLDEYGRRVEGLEQRNREFPPRR